MNSKLIDEIRAARERYAVDGKRPERIEYYHAQLERVLDKELPLPDYVTACDLMGWTSKFMPLKTRC